MNKLNNIHTEETHDTSYNHVLKYTGIFGGVQGLKMFISVVRNKLTSVFLGGTGIGLLSIYTSLFEFISCASNLGIPLNATRISGELFENGTTAEIEHFVRVVRTWSLWAAMLSVVVCMLFSPLISYFFFDKDWHRYAEVLLVIPIVVCFLLAEAESAILKGLRQLRRVAMIQTLTALTTLFLTVPFYYFLGLKGVGIGLIASGLASMLVHYCYSLKLVSYDVAPFSMRIFREGIPMIKIGIPYVISNIANAGLGMAIPIIMLWSSSTLADVGYYRVGWTMMVGYAGMVFMALEADYFPRLSSVHRNVDKMNQAINQQIVVCTLLLSPFLILLVLFMPWVIRLLHTPEFSVVQDMAVCASFYTFLRCISLPVGFSILAKGDAFLFLLLEVLYDLFFGFLIWMLYSLWGLTGAGIALSVGALYDVIVLLSICRYRYSCRVRHTTWYLFIVQFFCLASVVAVYVMASPEIMYFFGGGIFVTSASFSLFHLARRSSILHEISKRFHRFIERVTGSRHSS